MAWTDDKFSLIPVVDRGGDGCTVQPSEILGYKRDGEWMVDHCTGWRRDSQYDGIVVKFDHDGVGRIITVPIEDVRRLRDERDDEIERLHGELDPAHALLMEFARMYSLYLDDRYLDDLSPSFLEWLPTSLYRESIAKTFDDALQLMRSK